MCKNITKLRCYEVEAKSTGKRCKQISGHNHARPEICAGSYIMLT